MTVTASSYAQSRLAGGLGVTGAAHDGGEGERCSHPHNRITPQRRAAAKREGQSGGGGRGGGCDVACHLVSSCQTSRCAAGRGACSSSRQPAAAGCTGTMSGAPDDIFHKIRKFDWYRTAQLISPETARKVDVQGQGGMALHLALGARQVVPEDICFDLLLANPEAAKYKDRAGKLPLHYAAEFNSCSPACFKAVLDAYPEGAHELNKWGACAGSSAPVLCSAAAAAAAAAGAGGKQGAHVRVCVWGAWLCSVAGQTPLHYATWRRASPDILQMLFDANPGAAAMRDTL
jgi:hypothetical protein